MSDYSDNKSDSATTVTFYESDNKSDSATTVSFHSMELFDEKTGQYITVARPSYYFDDDNDTVVSLYEFGEEDKIKTNNTHISVVSFVIILMAFILPYLY